MTCLVTEADVTLKTKDRRGGCFQRRREPVLHSCYLKEKNKKKEEDETQNAVGKTGWHVLDFTGERPREEKKKSSFHVV